MAVAPVKLSVLRTVHRDGDEYTAQVGLFDEAGDRIGFAVSKRNRTPAEAWSATLELAEIAEGGVRAVLRQRAVEQEGGERGPK